MQWASSTRRNADIARNCPSVRRMAAKSARLRRCSSSKMGKHCLVVAPGIRTHFATTICNDHLLQATSMGRPSSVKGNVVPSEESICTPCSYSHSGGRGFRSSGAFWGPSRFEALQSSCRARSS